MLATGLVLAAALAGAAGTTAHMETNIAAALERVAALKLLDYEAEYELQVRGRPVKARGIRFVDRRAAEEVLASGLTTGCGDSAGVFYHLLRAQGAELLFLQSADLSIANYLRFKAAGHTGVAVKDPASGRWTLVDPTAGKVLSRDWDPKSPLYGRRWIGHIGAAEGYFSQINEREGVGEFFQRTLSRVPKEVWDRELIGIDFVLEAAAGGPDGLVSDPDVRAFVALYSGVDRRLGFNPRRRVSVRLRPRPKGSGFMCDKDAAGFFCEIAPSRGMGERLFDFVEDSVHRLGPKL